MNNFLHAIKAEWITGRRTFLRYSPILMAILPLLLSMLIISNLIKNNIDTPLLMDVAQKYISINLMSLNTFFSVYCIFIAYYSFYKEHTYKLWKHINVQSVSGTMQMLTKHFYTWCYLAITLIMLSVLIPLGLWVIKFIYPSVNTELNDPNFLSACCQFGVEILITGMSIVSILNVISARFTSHMAIMLIGILGAFLPLYNIINHTNAIAPFIPWTIGNLFYQQFSKAIVGESWWIIIPFIWIAASLAVHMVLQKKRPLY